MTEANIEARLRRIEDRLEIAQLQARYAVHIDDRNLQEVGELFARCGRFRSADGVMDAVGRDAICDQYRGRFAALKFGFHVTHDHIIELNAADPDHAAGIVSSHAELVRDGQAMVAAMRYEDVYVREEGCWRFADRLLKFFYYLPVKNYGCALATPTRMRGYGDRRLADLPMDFAAEGP